MKKFIGLFLVFFLGLAACEKVKKVEEEARITLFPEPSPVETLKQEETETAEAPSLSVANVVLFPKGRDSVLLTVEVASTPEERRQGLQGRENLPENHGMWFAFENDVQDPFWMHETPLSLDILFIDKDDKIVDLVTNATPNSDTLIVSRQPYRFALELKAGSVDGYGLQAGDSVEFRLGPP